VLDVRVDHGSLGRVLQVRELRYDFGVRLDTGDSQDVKKLKDVKVPDAFTSFVFVWLHVLPFFLVPHPTSRDHWPSQSKNGAS